MPRLEEEAPTKASERDRSQTLTFRAARWTLVVCALACPAFLWITVDEFLVKESVLPGIFFLVPGLLLALGFFYQMALALAITEERIVKKTLFMERELPLEEIKGYRYDGRSRTLYLIPKDEGQRPLSVGDGFPHFKEIRQWAFGRFQSLDQQDEAAVLDEIAHDLSLGCTEQECMQKLASAKRIYLFAMLIMLALGLFWMWRPVPYWLCLTCCALAPIPLLTLVRRYRSLFYLGTAIKSPKLELNALLVWPALPLAWHALLRFGIGDCMALFRTAVCGWALFFGLAALAIGRLGRERKDAIIEFAVITALFTYGLVVHINCSLDQKASPVRIVAVEEKTTSAASCERHKIRIPGWKDAKGSNEWVLDTNEANRFVREGKIKVKHGPGLLGISWLAFQK